VKLLFDENVSPSLATRLLKEFPGSSSVSRERLRGCEDRQIWEYAREHGYAVVSKDTDFRERSYVEGAPPKVIWLDVGNGDTEAIEALLRRERGRVERFVAAEESSLLILSLGPQAF